MMMNTNKIALVTGGSRGLGKDMALALAAKGTDIILTYRSKAAEAESTARDIEELGAQAAILELDLSKTNCLPEFLTRFKNVLKEKWQTDRFDFLVNNAGMGATVPFLEVTEDLFDEFLNVHFKNVYFLTQQTVPMINEGGRIINISTGTTRFSNPGYSVYASMKGAVEVLTKYLAKELGARGIRANVVAPGPVETDFNTASIRNNPQLKATLGNLSPLGRVGQADDIGGVIAFLCSPEAAWINGQRIEVSGGING
jgi:NAD(P)-dependent dehydrogenase (short-subunit alcohol dehydrogenase family)